MSSPADRGREQVTVSCPAKVNPYLRVLAREHTGYHQIETVFLGVGLYDRLTLERMDEGIALEVGGDEDAGPAASNTVVRAAGRFFEAAGIVGGVRAHLDKAIPAGAGLGGGSSDAAGALLGLNALFGVPLSRAQLLRIAGHIGADVPFFVAGEPCALAWGRGDRLLPLKPPPEAWVVLVVPEARVATGPAYEALAGTVAMPAGPRELPASPTADWERLGRLQHNDFEVVVFPRHPELSRLRDQLEASGACVSRMTGSGSVVFGVYEAEALARQAGASVQGTPGVERVAVVPTSTRAPLNGVEPVR